MRIAVLGTGVVGRAHAAKLAELGHEVIMGTQDIEKTLSKTKPDEIGNPPFSVWHKENSKVKLATFADAAKHGEIIFEAIKGEMAVKTLKTLEKHLNNKIHID